MITRRIVATGLLTAAAGIGPLEQRARKWQRSRSHTSLASVMIPTTSLQTRRSGIQSPQSGLIEFTDFLQAIGVMKSTSKSWKDLVFPELHGGQAAERPGGPSTSTLLKDQV
jgi:hypothetical protein